MDEKRIAEETVKRIHANFHFQGDSTSPLWGLSANDILTIVWIFERVKKEERGDIFVERSHHVHGEAELNEAIDRCPGDCYD